MCGNGRRPCRLLAVAVALCTLLLVVVGCRRAAVDYSPPSDSEQYVHIGPKPKLPNPKKLPRRAKEMLDENGFVVMADYEMHNLKDAYFGTPRPVLITSDAVLYVFHCLFRGGLVEYEKSKLLPAIEGLVRAGLQAAEQDYAAREADVVLGPAAKRNLVFFAVASRLLGGPGSPAVAAEADPLVEEVIEAREWGYYPAEDFTIYEPRGHYAEDEGLSRYFRVTKWLSRQIMPIIPGARDDPQEADEKLRQAVLLGLLLKRNKDLRAKWQGVYDDISFFIGPPDSFTPIRLVGLADRLLPAGYDAGKDCALSKQDALAAIRAEYAKPRYQRSRIAPVLQANPGDAPSKYVQWMGERYIADGQIMQECCFPYTGQRLPKGLEVAVALFGSDRARHYLSDTIADDPRLGTQLATLRQAFSAHGAEENPVNVYAGWVGAIREVVHPPKSEHLPPFMKSTAWQDKSLQTALASWAQMRHDFVLYAKHPMIPGGIGPSPYVEPVPKLYRRIGRLAAGLAEREFPAMSDLAELCRHLAICAEVELAGKSPDREARASAAQLEMFSLWLLEHFAQHVPVERPAVVVDVATSSFEPRPVLHTATGPLVPIVARWHDPDFGDLTGIGWVMTYYEFTEDNLQRVTDEQWLKRVLKGQHRAARPAWTKSFMYQR